MRKILVFCLFISLILGFSRTNIYALENDVHNTQVYIEEKFEDGSYIEVITEQFANLERSSTISGAKTKNYKDTNGKIIWSIKVIGKFTYTGKSATCTSSTIDTTCNASNWKLSNKKATKSGATANASVTAKEYTFLGICAKTVNSSVTLTCSANGNLS